MSAKFLLVHPDTFTRRALEVALRDDHHNLRVAHEGLDAIDRALDEKPDAIILGVNLPGLSGVDVARALRALEPTQHIPILFIADDAAEADTIAQSGLSLVNCITSPVDLARFREHTDKLLRARLPTPEQGAHVPDRHLASISDPVTGLYERHYLLHRLAYESARAARYKNPLACILFGVDHFKDLVAEQGRASGDRALIEVANIFRRAARVTDVPGRANDDEFLLIAPHTDETGARQSAIRLLRLMQEHHFDLPGQYAHLDISVGLAAAAGQSLADNLALLGRAETALLQTRERNERIIAG